MQVEITEPRGRHRVKDLAQREKSEMDYCAGVSGPEPGRTAAPARSPGLWRVTVATLHRGIGAPTCLDHGGERSTAAPGSHCGPATTVAKPIKTRASAGPLFSIAPAPCRSAAAAAHRSVPGRTEPSHRRNTHSSGPMAMRSVDCRKRSCIRPAARTDPWHAGRRRRSEGIAQP